MWPIEISPPAHIDDEKEEEKSIFGKSFFEHEEDRIEKYALIFPAKYANYRNFIFISTGLHLLSIYTILAAMNTKNFKKILSIIITTLHYALLMAMVVIGLLSLFRPDIMR